MNVYIRVNIKPNTKTALRVAAEGNLDYEEGMEANICIGPLPSTVISDFIAEALGEGDVSSVEIKTEPFDNETDAVSVEGFL